MRRNGFTLIEVLIVIGILTILLSFVLVRLRPIEHKTKAQDIERQAMVKTLESAVSQYVIDTGQLPPGMPVGTTQAAAKPVCQGGVTGSACTGGTTQGIDLSPLVPVYMAKVPVDPAMTGSTITGYRMWSDGDDVSALAPYLGVLGGGRRTSSSAVSSAATSSVASSAASSAVSSVVASSSIPSSSRSSSTAASSSSIDATLMLHWKFNEGAGTTTADASGHGLTGAFQGSPTWTSATPAISGGNPYALTFNVSGAGQGVQGSSLLTGVNDWTLAAWMKPVNTGQSEAMVLHNGDFYTGYGFMMASGNQLWGHFPNVATSWLNGNYSFTTANIWYHVAMTRTGGVTRFYVNGTPRASVTSGSPTTPAPFTGAGKQPGASRAFGGGIDDVRLYSRALSAAEVLSLAQGNP